MEKCSGMAGIVRVEVVEDYAVERLRRLGGEVAVWLADGEGWRELRCEAAEYEESGDSGDAVSRTLRCTIPIGQAELLSKIKEATQARWVARVTDGRGERWIIGDDQEPLELTWSRTNEGKAEGKDAVTVQLGSEGRWGATTEKVG